MYRPTFTTNAGRFTQGIGDTGGTNGIGNGIVEGRFAAPYLAWEIEDKQNYGFDLGLFDNRIDIIFDYFRSERRDICYSVVLFHNWAGFVKTRGRILVKYVIRV